MWCVGTWVRGGQEVELPCFVFSEGDDELAVGADQPWEGTGRGAAQANILFLPFLGFSIFPLMKSPKM